MRLWIVMALLAGSAAATVRHAMGHRHTVVIPLLLIPALVLGWQEWNFRSDENRFSTIATEIAGRDVAMQCQRFSGALLDVTAELGYVPFNVDGSPTDSGRLERDACNDLRAYYHGDMTNPPIEQVVAVQVLTHESFHLAGIRNEAETECAAMQHLAQVATELGATPDQGRQLADRYYAEIYPRMRDDYRSADCVNEGELDIAPDDPVWP